MHFFIDHGKLSPQLAADRFGPSTADPSNVYNVTSRFKLTNPAKAFACETGMMVVQQSTVDDTLVNLILKPAANLRALADVTYYIYRGVLKDSLLATGCVLQNTGTNSELLARIWAKNPTDTSCGTLGYDEGTIPNTDSVESIFDDSRANVKPVFVKEGEWIGTFGTAFKIGFEVLLNTQRFIVTLGYVRAEKYQVTVAGLADMALRIKREEILNFVDPAAFFGLHIDQKVGYSEYTPTKVTRKTSTVVGHDAFIYTKLLQNFATRNRVYFDIRSEKGYSYNFYRNYGETGTNHNIDVAFQAAAGVPQIYGTNSWPILVADASQTTAATTNNLKIKLRIDDNTVPIIFIKNKFFKHTNNTTSYIKDNEISVSAGVTLTTWSNRLQFNFRNTGAGAKRPSIANYIKLNYFRQRHNAAAPAGVLRNEKYYDSAFCSIDLPRLGDAAAVKKFAHSAEPIYVRELNNADGTGNFGLNLSNGAFWDANRVLFYGTFQYENSDRTSEKEYLNTYSQKLVLTNPDYIASNVHTKTEILCRSYRVGASTIRIPSVNLFRGKGVGKNYKESALFLGLTVAQVASLRANTQLGTLHQRLIHLQADATNPQADTGGNRYFRYTVQLQGMAGNANPTRITPLHAGNPIVVYSRDNQFFSSRDFAATETVTAGQNRIALDIFHDGCVKITDNKDLALVNDVERIYFRYHNAANVAVEACNLDVVMADKMRRVSYNSAPRIIAFPSIPADFVQFIDYAAMNVPGVSASASFRNPNGDIFTSGTDGNRKYVNDKKKVFLVHFDRNLVIAAPSLAIDLTYVNTLRHYARPDLAAAVIGALVQIAHPIICQGFAYADASCYPSAEHVNGEALDTNYNFTLANDVAFINALNRYGFRLHRVGRTVYLTSLHNHDVHDKTVMDPQPTNPLIAPLHNSHLHSTDLSLRDCQRIL
ncbi:MAG: hypothetical protein ACXW5U_16350 [Thermoanaerobaculia bacterium]